MKKRLKKTKKLIKQIKKKKPDLKIIKSLISEGAYLCLNDFIDDNASPLEKDPKGNLLNPDDSHQLYDYYDNLMEEWLHRLNFSEPLKEAALNNHFNIVKLLIKSGCNVNSYAFDSALLDACQSGNLKIVKFLMNNKIEFSTVENSDLPGKEMAWAAENGFYDIVKYLLDRGIDPSCYNDEGPGLYQSIRGGHEDIARLLIESGAEVWEYAFVHAAEYGCIDTLNLLIEKTRDPESDIKMDFNIDDGIALERAINSGEVKAVSILLKVMDAQIIQNYQEIYNPHIVLANQEAIDICSELKKIGELDKIYSTISYNEWKIDVNWDGIIDTFSAYDDLPSSHILFSLITLMKLSEEISKNSNPKDIKNLKKIHYLYKLLETHLHKYYPEIFSDYDAYSVYENYLETISSKSLRHNILHLTESVFIKELCEKDINNNLNDKSIITIHRKIINKEASAICNYFSRYSHIIQNKPIGDKRLWSKLEEIFSGNANVISKDLLIASIFIRQCSFYNINEKVGLYNYRRSLEFLYDLLSDHVSEYMNFIENEKNTKEYLKIYLN